MTATRQLSELRLVADPSQLRAARAYTSSAASAFGFDNDDCFDFTCAVNEAVTNAIRHGAPDEHGRIHLSVLAHGDRLTLVVRDFGTFKAPAPDRAATSEHGRGLQLMDSLADDILLCIEQRGTAVHLSKTRAVSSPPPQRSD